jgi:hypothetical protein
VCEDSNLLTDSLLFIFYNWWSLFVVFTHFTQMIILKRYYSCSLSGWELIVSKVGFNSIFLFAKGRIFYIFIAVFGDASKLMTQLNSFNLNFACLTILLYIWLALWRIGIFITQVWNVLQLALLSFILKWLFFVELSTTTFSLTIHPYYCIIY